MITYWSAASAPLAQPIQAPHDEPAIAASTPPSVGELCLRIRGGQRAGQVVRLRSSRCAIGSADYCTLRLRAPGVRPIHCLVLRGPGGMIVRRWSSDTRLNGRDFQDAPLQLGDRLGVGPLELEVVDSTAQCESPASADSTAPVAQAAAALALAQVSSALEQALAETSEQRDRTNQLHQTLAQLQLSHQSKQDEQQLAATSIAQLREQVLLLTRQCQDLRSASVAPCPATDEPVPESHSVADSSSPGLSSLRGASHSSAATPSGGHPANPDYPSIPLPVSPESSSSYPHAPLPGSAEYPPAEQRFTGYPSAVDPSTSRPSGESSFADYPPSAYPAQPYEAPSAAPDAYPPAEYAPAEYGSAGYTPPQFGALEGSMTDYPAAPIQDDRYQSEGYSPAESQYPPATASDYPSPPIEQGVESTPYQTPSAAYDSPAPAPWSSSDESAPGESQSSDPVESDHHGSPVSALEILAKYARNCEQDESAGDHASSDRSSPDEPVAAHVLPWDRLSSTDQAEEMNPQSPEHSPAQSPASNPFDAAASSDQSLHTAHASPAKTQPSAAAAAEEESIEAYMARLLNRVRGDGDRPSAPAPSAPRSSAPIAPPSASPPAAASETASQPLESGASQPEEPIAPYHPAGSQPLEQHEYVPRKAAPERNLSMKAMRDLANASARSAIDTHTKSRWGLRVVEKVIVTLAAIATGGGVLLSDAADTVVIKIASCTALVTGCVWLVQAYYTYLSWRRACLKAEGGRVAHDELLAKPLHIEPDASPEQPSADLTADDSEAPTGESVEGEYPEDQYADEAEYADEFAAPETVDEPTAS